MSGFDFIHSIIIIDRIRPKDICYMKLPHNMFPYASQGREIAPLFNNITTNKIDDHLNITEYFPII